jgi:hypothetical protein
MANVRHYGCHLGSELVGHLDCRRAAVGTEIDSLNSAGYLASQHPVLFTLFGSATTYLLHSLREWYRVAYATIEILIRFWAFLTIIAAIYLMVRGLDNLDRVFDKTTRWNAVSSALGIKERP